MARPASTELTERELEVMHVFWKQSGITAMEARQELAQQGVDRAYVTVANLVRVLVEKRFLEPTNQQRPFRYRPVRSFAEPSVFDREDRHRVSESVSDDGLDTSHPVGTVLDIRYRRCAPVCRQCASGLLFELSQPPNQRRAPAGCAVRPVREHVLRKSDWVVRIAVAAKRDCAWIMATENRVADCLAGLVTR